MYTAKNFETAIGLTLAKARSDVVQAWAIADTPERREQLWNEHKAIERIEETIRNDFASIIERAAGGGEPDR